MLVVAGLVGEQSPYGYGHASIHRFHARRHPTPHLSSHDRFGCYRHRGPERLSGEGVKNRRLYISRRGRGTVSERGHAPDVTISMRGGRSGCVGAEMLLDRTHRVLSGTDVGQNHGESWVNARLR